MKTKLTFLSLVILLITTSFIGDKEYRTNGGIYQTAEDYLKGNLTDCGVYTNIAVGGMIGGNYIEFVKDGKKVQYNFKKENFWGFRDKRGDDYMISRTSGLKLYQIIIAGKIWVWGDELGHTTTYRNEKGEVTGYSLGTLCYSKGISDPPIDYNYNKEKERKALSEWFSDDAEIQKKWDNNQEKLRRSGSPSQRGEIYAVTFSIINEYNQKHK